MDTRSPNSRGGVTIQMVILMVPVFLGLMGFAIDLGQLYLIRNELKNAANAMALAAASKLIGTETATDAAILAARMTLNDAAGFGNKYVFSGVRIGESTGFLNSEALDPVFYAALADALGSEGASGAEAGGTTAKYAKVVIEAEAPLLFWGLLTVGQERKTQIRVDAVAGVSAPLCTACGIEPIAIAAVDPEEPVDFGFVINQRYTFSYQCSGQQPQPLPNSIRISYLLLNRYNEEATVFPEEGQQVYRIGAGGLPPSANPAYSCIQMYSENGESVWVNATPSFCGQAPAVVSTMVCGLAARFENVPPGACAEIPEVDSMISAYTQDTDLSDIEDYTLYTGNGRRIITVAIVDALVPQGPMTVLGFRQFLLEPASGGTNINPAETNGRFAALYIGSVMPLKAGTFGGCTQTAGPGKVVLHQ